MPELSKSKYYRKFVLEFLKAEHQHAGDSLSSVLRNGTVVVRIKDLKNKYPIGSDFLYSFSKKHPEILERYKNELRKSAQKSGSVPSLATRRKILTATERLKILQSINPGNAGASDFHKISFDSLIHIFGERLSNPLREREINEGRKRIDIVFDNADKTGFFNDLNVLYHVKCPKIFVECKNYGKEVGNPELDQLSTRFTARRGMFGILLCRSINNKVTLLKRCKDALDRGDHMIVLDDDDLGKLLHIKESGKEREIDNFLREKFDDLIM